MIKHPIVKHDDKYWMLEKVVDGKGVLWRNGERKEIDMVTYEVINHPNLEPLDLDSVLIEGMTDYLNNHEFYEPTLISQQDDKYFFRAFDNDEETEVTVMFEPIEDGRVCVSVQRDVRDPFVILETLSPEDVEPY